MKHASAEALDRLAPLLTALRAVSGLAEKRQGVFYYRGRTFLHFHEDPTGLFADLRLPGDDDFNRHDVSDEPLQAALLARVRKAF